MSERMVNKSPDLSIFKRKGNNMLSYLLDCISMGDTSRIKALFDGDEYIEVTNLIVGNELTFIKMVFQYLAPQIVRTAVEGGLPWKEATEEYLRYVELSGKSGSVTIILELLKKMFLDYAEKVARINHSYSPVIRECRMYILEHLGEKLSVDSLAEHLFVSGSHLSHIFREETGETVADCIKRSRMVEAKRMVQHTSESITVIGEKLGYSSPSHFASVFRKEVGMTPTEFRSRNR